MNATPTKRRAKNTTGFSLDFFAWVWNLKELEATNEKDDNT
jgi:hypothetical protein